MAALTNTGQQSLLPTSGSRTAAMLPTQPPVSRNSLTRGPISILQNGKSSAVEQPSAGLTSSAIATAVWNELKSLHTTPGTYGYLLDTSISGLPTAPSSTTVANAVWDTTQASHTGAGTFGKYLDAQVSAIKTRTDTLPASPAATGDAMTLTTGERTSVGTAVWATTTRSLTTFGTLVADTAAAVWATTIESTLTAVQSVRLLLSRAAAKVTVVDNGDGTSTISYRSLDDSKDRIVGTIDHATGSVTSVTTRDGT